MKWLWASVATLPWICGAQVALAQSAAPGASVQEEIIVTAFTDALAGRLDAAPGGVSVLASSGFADTNNLTISRALATVPGVVVQDFFGGNDQPRVQIRGSGLQQNPVERGILMLRNGLPLNQADGSYIVGIANPGDADAVEVYRGYMANRLGASVLGGAINLISPTGRSAPGFAIGLGGGSFGQFTANAQAGFAMGDNDLLLHAGLTRRDGYRDYNDSRRLNLGGNVGLAITDDIRARVFVNYTELDFDISGPLPKDAMQANPRQVWTGPVVTPQGAVYPGPNVVRDLPGRSASQLQSGVRVSGVFDAHVVDLLLGFTHTDDSFNFPISSGERATTSNDLTLVGRYAWKPDAAAELPLFEATAQYVTGRANRNYYLNLSGQRGAQFGRNRLKADMLSLHAGLNLPIVPGILLSPSVDWARATRGNQDRYAAPTRPTAAYNPANPLQALPAGAVPTVDSSYARAYSAWSPALALSWHPAGGQTIFAALSRSFEPPTHDDLFATINGTSNSTAGRPAPPMPFQPAAVFATPDLKAQTATTLEAGWRGKAGDVRWDIVAYHSWVKNELLSLRDEAGSSLGAANAARTRHLGIEAGASWQMLKTLDASLTYNFQDFRFRDDPLRGNNRLAGAPRHWIYLALGWQPLNRFRLDAAMRWVPQRTPVDNLNTVWNDPYATVDLRGRIEIAAGVSAFAEVTNLFGKTYATSTLIVDQARPDQAAFLPGDGRAFGAGVKLRF